MDISNFNNYLTPRPVLYPKMSLDRLPIHKSLFQGLLPMQFTSMNIEPIFFEIHVKFRGCSMTFSLN